MDYYTEHASRLALEYDSADPEQVHKLWRDKMRGKTGLACDIGAGSGRDANWLAGQGWDVVAVEPNKRLRERARNKSDPRVTWLDDKLPKLKRLRQVGYRFDLILVNAVWMHLSEVQRSQAFRVVSELLAPNGLLVITLRQTSNVAEMQERGFYDVQPEELIQAGKRRALQLVKQGSLGDGLGRTGVRWDTLCFQLPDDGTGSLPLLRHIIVNDNKSASYKLGLLRALLRVAEGAPGMVLNRTEDYVDIPFGILGLYWLKLYVPLLIKHELRQQVREGAGYLFATEAFYKLSNISSFDLRIGARFSGDIARAVTGAIRAACYNIKQNPAHFTTYPGTDRPVFQSDYRSVRTTDKPIQLDKAFLSGFGTFRIPAQIWQTMGHYTCWLEPAIVNEWVALMNDWKLAYSSDTYYSALAWEEGRRDTQVVRKISDQLSTQGAAFRCVWTNANLAGKDYAIDHCFPWSRWFNNDLWNLVPATRLANNRKSDKIPSAELALSARPRILEWWDSAYLADGITERFILKLKQHCLLLTRRTGILTASLTRCYCNVKNCVLPSSWQSGMANIGPIERPHN